MTRLVITSAASTQLLAPSWQAISKQLCSNRPWHQPIATGLLLAASLQLALAPAQAIPEADALKKLAVVPVFVMTDSKGVPLPIAKDKTLVLPLYLERTRAEAELATLRKANPSLLPKLVAIPLGTMTAKVKQLQLQLKDKSRTLVAPVVASPADRQQATLMLKQQGLTDKQIQDGLVVPVFFTKPFLSLPGPQPTAGKAPAPVEPKLVFFMSYASLQAAIANVPPAKRVSLKPQVADLSAVLRQIIQSPQDRYVIFPTADYFPLVQQQQHNQPRPGARAQPQLLAPSQTTANPNSGSPSTSQLGRPSVSPLASQTPAQTTNQSPNQTAGQTAPLQGK